MSAKIWLRAREPDDVFKKPYLAHKPQVPARYSRALIFESYDKDYEIIMHYSGALFKCLTATHKAGYLEQVAVAFQPVTKRIFFHPW